jgi:cullin 1
LLFFVKKWDEWSFVTKVLNHILAYLNRTWVKTQRSSATNSTVYEIGMTADVVWRDHMLVGGLKERLGEAMLRLIADERNGNAIQPHLIRNCLNCFVRMGLNRENPQNPTLDVYKQHFEKRFLEETEVYYTGEAMKVLNESGVTAYMKRVEQRLTEEVGRVERYLNPTTQKPLTECLERVLIATHKDAIHAKFVELLRNDANEDIRRMYALLSRVEGGLEPLKALLEQYIRTIGLDAILAEKKEASEKPDVFVNILLRVFRKYTELISMAFHNDPGFVLALDKAFRDFVNKNAVTEEDGASGADADKAMAKAPQILARYCDSILRKGATISEEEMERTQNDIVSLFKYFPDKGPFHFFPFSSYSSVSN